MEDTVIYIANYAANYGGNFIRSLRVLAEIRGGVSVFLFPEGAKVKSWVSELEGHEVLFASFSGRGFHEACEGLAVRYGKSALVHTHFVEGLHLAQVLRTFKRVVCHQHMAIDAPADWRGAVKALAKRLIYGSFYSKAKFVAVSKPVAESLSALYPNVAIKCVPNAIDFSRYDENAARSIARPHTPLRALIFGTHFERKAVDVAIDACERLTSCGREVMLAIPTHNIADAVGKVEALKGGVPSWVHIVPVTEDVASLYDSADVFLSPSRSEAFGYAVVEAAYMGCGVVASDVPGQNSLKDIVGIQWVNPEDPDGLADAMLASRDLFLSRAPEDLDALRDDLELQYGIERWVADMLAVYESIE